MNMFIRFVVSLSSFFVAIFLVEGLSRFMHSRSVERQGLNDYLEDSRKVNGTYLYKPNLNLKLNGVSLKTNSLGLKGAVEVIDLNSNCFKVAFLGSSWTAGTGVNTSQSYPYQLQKLVNKSNPKKCFQIINASIPSHTMEDMVKVYRFVLKTYKPDFSFFLLNKNSMSSSLKIENKTNNVLPKENHTHEYLKLIWGIDSNFIDIDEPVKVERKTPRGWSDDLYTYKLLSKWADIIKNKVKNDPCISKRCIEVCPQYESLRKENLPCYSALYLSPYHRDKFRKNIEKTLSLADKFHSQIAFVSFDFFIEPLEVRGPFNFKFFHLSEIIDFSVKGLFDEYSLPKDFHLNQKGHSRIAEGFYHYFFKNNAFKLVSPKNRTKRYINESRKSASLHEGNIESSIDLKNRKHIHQVISGINPNQRLNQAKISFLLRKKNQKKLLVKGNLRGVKNKIISIWLRDEKGNEFVTKYEMSVGNFDYRIPVALSPGIVDINVICEEVSCDQIIYDFVGFE